VCERLVYFNILYSVVNLYDHELLGE